MPDPAAVTNAHAAIGIYRSALDDAKHHATALATAAINAGQAAKALAPFVQSPLPVIAWTGAPPVAEWIADLDTLIAEFKAGLAK